MIRVILVATAIALAPAVAVAGHKPEPPPARAPEQPDGRTALLFSEAELQEVAQALAQQPYIVAAPVIADIQRQVAEAQAAALPHPSPPPLPPKK